MATFKTYSRGFGRYSDLVLGNVFSSDLGHCVREINLVKTATMQLGSVLTAAGVEAAAAGDAATVLVWTDVTFDIADVPVGETFTAVVAKRDLTLNRFKVVYSDGSLIDDAGVAALEEVGLKLTAKVLVTS